MLLYFVVPHHHHTWDDITVYSSFSAVEQFVLQVAAMLAERKSDPNWCKILAYEGQDELHPTFVYTFVGVDRLRRVEWPTPSS
jgi:hypothetical protein